LQLPRWDIGLVKRSFALAQLEDKENLDLLKELATGYFGQSVQLTVRSLEPDQADVHPPSLQKSRQVEESDRKRKLREDALDHPLVKSAQEIFGGTVKEVRPIDKGFV
jgi:DNA polymerase III subunit gamma/tau